MLPKILFKMDPPVSAQLIRGHALADKLFADYLFNEGSGLKVFNQAGRGHHGVITGAATWGMGKHGRAVDLDGSTGHIVVPDHDDFTPAGTPLSISAWIYMRSALGFFVASKGLYNTDGEWVVGMEGNGKLFSSFRDESVDDCYIGRAYNTPLTPYEDSWIHLVWTYDGGATNAAIRNYFNATRVDDADRPSNADSFKAVENLNHDVWIGRMSTNYADGLIGRVTFWRRVLTASDVKKLIVAPFCMYERRRRSLVTI